MSLAQLQTNLGRNLKRWPTSHPAHIRRTTDRKMGCSLVTLLLNFRLAYAFTSYLLVGIYFILAASWLLMPLDIESYIHIKHFARIALSLRALNGAPLVCFSASIKSSLSWLMRELVGAVTLQLVDSS